MPIGLIHGIQSLIAFGRPYMYVHARKDAAARYAPGLRHRRVRHGWYRAYGRLWDSENPFPEIVQRRTERIGRFRGPERAEEYQVAVSHDYSDRIWDLDGLPREERTLRRKYWEGFYIWLLLTPRLLRDWAGVDVLAFRIQRVIDGVEVWEEAPELEAEYKQLCARAYFVLRCDRVLRKTVEICGGLCIEGRAV